jgi:uncharacterized protein YegJ (DUF2314 family)
VFGEKAMPMIDEADSDDDDAQPEGEPDSWPSDEWPMREYTPEANWAIFESDLTVAVFFAQATFLEFARAAEYERFRILPTYETIGIKAFFEKGGNPRAGEHIFLTDVFTDGKSITATLNADAWHIPNLKEGQDVTFSIAKLSDWFLVRNGRGLGGFTIPHIWSQLSETEQEQVENEPPFVWFKHRGTASARDELLALPKCPKCHRRNIDSPTDVKSPCAICHDGSWRCDCPKCGAPLIRNQKLPKTCARCTARK